MCIFSNFSSYVVHTKISKTFFLHKTFKIWNRGKKDPPFLLGVKKYPKRTGFSGYYGQAESDPARTGPARIIPLLPSPLIAWQSSNQVSHAIFASAAQHLSPPNRAGELHLPPTQAGHLGRLLPPYIPSSSSSSPLLGWRPGEIRPGLLVSYALPCLDYLF